MRRTLFSLLLKDRNLTIWEVFCVPFTATGRELARETGNRRLATVGLGRTTFDRWSSGTWYGRPRGEAAQILECMFGYPVAVLFSPASDTSQSAVPVESVATRIGSRWPTSSCCSPRADPPALGNSRGAIAWTAPAPRCTFFPSPGGTMRRTSTT